MALAIGQGNSGVSEGIPPSQGEEPIVRVGEFPQSTEWEGSTRRDGLDGGWGGRLGQGEGW